MSSIKELINEASANSEFSSDIIKLKSKKGASYLFDDSIRRLTAAEVKKLKEDGNTSDNWKNIFVVENFIPENIKNNVFVGKVILGNFPSNIIQKEGMITPSGIYNSVIADSEIGNGAAIRDVRNIANYIIKDNAFIVNVGKICCEGETLFANGNNISVAIETGGREVKAFAEINIAISEQIAKNRSDKKLQNEYNKFIDDYCEKIKFSKGIIEENAVVLNTNEITNTFIGKSCLIKNTTLIRNSTILSNEEEQTSILNGAYVNDSIIQWGCGVDTMAIVDSSVLIEHSHAERHAKVIQSIIGPNSVIAEGEITSSLVGPFVGFHHQALLIAALWAEGKGNVGYGANVGSNHTGKAPDQEILPGEGTFFGLGVNIKFPSNFSKAPYSIFATGVNTLPQIIEYPFSLINVPMQYDEKIPPAFNEISPGWVLKHNIYSIKRNEIKYASRDKSRRSKINYDVFSPEIMKMVEKSRDILKIIYDKKKIYTSKEFPGLGKNFMKEESRQEAVDVYSFFLEYYGLKGLKKIIADCIKNNKIGEIKNLFKKESPCPVWEYEKKILLQELPKSDIKSYLVKYVEYTQKIAKSVLDSKEKDDIRGQKIIEDYKNAHGTAKDDKFVAECFKEQYTIEQEVNEILTSLKL